MIRRPPTSTLFPTRRSSDLFLPRTPDGDEALSALQSRLSGPAFEAARAYGRRSEEHTSELQSRRDLVCRLLLEKKKKQESPPEQSTGDSASRGRGKESERHH